MKQVQCDRCKCLIEEKSLGDKVVEVYNNAVHTIRRALFNEQLYFVMGEDGPVDLCPACKKSFDEWWKSGNMLEIEEAQHASN